MPSGEINPAAYLINGSAKLKVIISIMASFNNNAFIQIIEPKCVYCEKVEMKFVYLKRRYRVYFNQQINNLFNNNLIN